MSGITTLLWDLGGVLLSNGWDTEARRRAADQFKLEWRLFEERHRRFVPDFETGRLNIHGYLARTIFFRERSFTEDEFREFMFAQSRPFPESLAIARALAASGQYVLATVNNESFELNQYRIEEFGLTGIFTAFFSSCILGVKKPDPSIFRMALRILQRAPGETLFIEDRPQNVQRARRSGIHAIRYRSPKQLTEALARYEVVPEGTPAKLA